MRVLEFKPTPLHKIIVNVLKKLDRELGAIELAKILYLIDVEGERFFGTTLSEEEYTRQERGPLPWHFHSAIREMDGSEVTKRIERRLFQPKHSHRLGDVFRFDHILSPEEEFIIERIIKKVKTLSPRQIEQLAYDTEPMKEILAEEALSGSMHLGEKIDFGLVEENPHMKKWRENKEQYEANPDMEYERYFKKEMANYDQSLAAG